MKVKIEVELEVEADHELNPKEHHNMVGAVARLIRNRLTPYLGTKVGGEHAATGWEVGVKSVKVSPVSKSRKG
jgi:hypothetical protein